MKILIFSDNHGEVDNVERIIKINQPLDYIFSLGDSEMKEKDLSVLDVIGVKGNYPYEPKFPYELNFRISGWNCYFTHGHLYNVKSGLTKLKEKAFINQFDLVLFGHTHRIHLEEENNTIFLNPGSLSTWRSNENPTYAIINVEENNIEIKVFNIYQNLMKSLVKKR